MRKDVFRHKSAAEIWDDAVRGAKHMRVDTPSIDYVASDDRRIFINKYGDVKQMSGKTDDQGKHDNSAVVTTAYSVVKHNTTIRIDTSKSMIACTVTGNYLVMQLFDLATKAQMHGCEEIKHRLASIGGYFRDIEKEIAWILYESEKDLKLIEEKECKEAEERLAQFETKSYTHIANPTVHISKDDWGR